LKRERERERERERIAIPLLLLAVGSWFVKEHVNAVAAVLGAVIGSCDSFLCGEEVGRTWDNGCSSCAGS